MLPIFTLPQVPLYKACLEEERCAPKAHNESWGYLHPIQEGLIKATATKLNVSITFWKSESELPFLCRNRSRYPISMGSATGETWWCIFRWTHCFREYRETAHRNQFFSSVLEGFSNEFLCPSVWRSGPVEFTLNLQIYFLSIPFPWMSCTFHPMASELRAMIQVSSYHSTAFLLNYITPSNLIKVCISELPWLN